MKKVALIILLMVILSPIFVVAKQYNYDNNYNIYLLRAGGGSSGSSGGSGGSGNGTAHGHHGYTSSYTDNPISDIVNIFLFIFIAFTGSILLYFKVVRSSINSKRYLKILGKKDVAWKYKNIEQQVIETFYSVQNSWTNMNMKSSKKYMAEKLYDSFEIKLNFMEMNNKRNILKMIKLLDIKPVSIYDDEDDDNDLIWFYIKGFMIDYIIDTETKEKIEGTEFPTTFVEFWKFTRKGKDKWVLDKIKQEDEFDTIDFQ